MESMPIRCRTIIEVAGKPKEHVEKTIKAYVEKLKTEDGIMVMKEEFSQAQEREQLWTTFVELEMIVKGLNRFIAFCLDYMPSSVEIIKPEDFNLKNTVITDFINEMQAKLHNVDTVAKNLRIENDFIKRNMNALIKNSILLSLRLGHLSQEQLSKTTGINGEELRFFIDKLIEENKIKKEENFYNLVAKR